MEKILLVEDDQALRNAAHEILTAEGYLVSSAENGVKALEAFNLLNPDLIISDLSMPKMGGFDLLDTIRSQEMGIPIPFIIISARTDKENMIHARQLGSDDYLVKPFELSELINAIRVRLDRRRAILMFDTREAHLQTVKMMANAIEARDHYTRGHIDRVRKYSLAFGSALGWKNEKLEILEFGAILHDIGKIAVPDTILNKKDDLDPWEMAQIHRHVNMGEEMLKGITHLQPAIPYVLYHHERWDGSGYPFGLAGNKIPLEGRLLAIVDVYDALTSDRPYHLKISKEKALEEISRKQGIKYDPNLIKDFLLLMQSIS